MITKSLPLHCVYCNAYMGEFVSVAQYHSALDHPDEDIPSPQVILDHCQLVADSYRLRHLVGALEALIPGDFGA